jgi:hypothetical protein
MAGLKRAVKEKLEVVKPASNLHFSDSIGQRAVSVYTKALTEALNTGGAVVIMLADAYMKHQLKASAKKLGVRLVFAIDGDKLYVKPLVVEGDIKRLMLFLREPRTENELMGKKLELHLKNTLAKLAQDGVAHFYRDKWVLTEKGLGAL